MPQRVCVEQLTGAVYIAEKLDRQKAVWACRWCDWAEVGLATRAPEHRCGEKPTFKPGTAVRHALTAVGITEERVNAVLAAVGLPPGCGCSKREKWLNELGDKLGEAAKTAVSSLWAK